MNHSEFLTKFNVTKEQCPYSDYQDIECFYTNCESFKSQTDFFKYAKRMDYPTLLETARIYLAEVSFRIQNENTLKDIISDERRKSAELESKLRYIQDFVGRNRTAIEENIKNIRIQTAGTFAKEEIEDVLSL